MTTLNRYAYWQAPPPEPSPKLKRWIARIKAGWRPNRRIRQMGYDEKAEFFGVYLWEYLNVIAPMLQEAEPCQR